MNIWLCGRKYWKTLTGYLSKPNYKHFWKNNQKSKYRKSNISFSKNTLAASDINFRGHPTMSAPERGGTAGTENPARWDSGTGPMDWRHRIFAFASINWLSVTKKRSPDYIFFGFICYVLSLLPNSDNLLTAVVLGRQCFCFDYHSSWCLLVHIQLWWLPLQCLVHLYQFSLSSSPNYENLVTDVCTKQGCSTVTFLTWN